MANLEPVVRAAAVDGAGWTAPAAMGAVLRRYVDDLVDVLSRLDVDRFAAVADAIVSGMVQERRILVAGNGGSAATASHMANDWTTAADAVGLHPLVLSLADSAASVTATGNDASFDDVFATQVRRWGRRGDVLVLLSVSGTSTNLLRAAEAARGLGMVVLSLLGRPGHLALLSDDHAALRSGDYGIVEDLHLALNHALVRGLHAGESRLVAGSEPSGHEAACRGPQLVKALATAPIPSQAQSADVDRLDR